MARRSQNALLVTDMGLSPIVLLYRSINYPFDPHEPDSKVPWLMNCRRIHLPYDFNVVQMMHFLEVFIRIRQ